MMSSDPVTHPTSEPRLDEQAKDVLSHLSHEDHGDVLVFPDGQQNGGRARIGRDLFACIVRLAAAGPSEDVLGMEDGDTDGDAVTVNRSVAPSRDEVEAAIAGVDAMIAKKEASVAFRVHESKVDVLPAFHGIDPMDPQRKRRIDVDEDPRYGERHRSIGAKEQGLLDALRTARAALLALYRPAGETVQAIRDKAFCEAINILRTHFVSGSVLERQYAMAADTLRGLLGKSTAEIDAILAERPAAPAGETRAGAIGVTVESGEGLSADRHWYHVRVGAYTTSREDAERLATQVRAALPPSHAGASE